MSVLETQTHTYRCASKVMSQQGIASLWFGTSARTLRQVARYSVSDHLRRAAVNTLKQRGCTIELRPGPNGGSAA